MQNSWKGKLSKIQYIKKYNNIDFKINDYAENVFKATPVTAFHKKHF